MARQNFLNNLRENNFFLKISALLIAITCLAAISLLININQKNTSNPQKTEAYILKEIKNCNDNKQTNSCYKQAATYFLNRYQLEEILSVFKKNGVSSGLLKGCHAVSHYLGQKEYKRLKSIKAVFAKTKDDVCMSGTMHGAIEGFFMEIGVTNYEQNISKIQEAIPSVCGEEKTYDNPLEYDLCIHGLGHALMFVTDNDLILTLKLCDYIKTEKGQDFCYSGSFMQNALDALSIDHPSKYFKPDDPIYPCNILENKYQEQCFSYGVLSSLQLNPLKSIEVCLQVPEIFQHGCFKTYGIDRTTVRLSEKEIKNECDLIKINKYKIDCFDGAAFNIVARYGLNSSMGYKFCLELPAEFKDSCYKNIGRTARRSTKDIRLVENYCNKIYEKQYKKICTSG